MIALIFMLVLFGIGVRMIYDGWWSLTVHWKRDGQTFGKDQVFRFERIFWGFVLAYMAFFFGVQMFVSCNITM
jgi:hypothetical protein